ncbi:MAG: hypothetical protein M1834_007004 [Cirrosporium novae-zelandiae]|nr:MAG: hypothetical protein M1834_007004 [Cirrosporium novae-zelandiae]
MMLRSSLAHESLASTGFWIRDTFRALEEYFETHDPNEFSRKGVSKIELINQSQRFSLWAINLGLYQHGHGSLDYRFRDAPAVYDFARRLLASFEEPFAIIDTTLVNETLGLKPHWKNDPDPHEDGEGHEDCFEQDTDSDEDEPLVQVALDSLVDLIDRLYRLSFRIRNPSTRIGFSKAYAYHEVDETTGIDLIDCFKCLDYHHMQEVIGQLHKERCEYCKDTQNGEDHFLVQRLAKANTRRRQQFRYWQKHKSKLERIGRDPQQGIQLPPKQKNLLGSSNSTGPYAAEAITLSLSSTATRVEDARIDLDDNSSVISTSTYAIMAQEDTYEGPFIPQLPIKFREEKEFECPYCFILCSTRIMEKRAWEIHVLRDLRPYVCTYEDCKEADLQYDSLRDWINHEYQHHINISSLNGSPPESFERECPFCLTKNISPSHVASHLQRIACFALPRAMSMEVGSEEGDSGSSNANRGSQEPDDDDNFDGLSSLEIEVEDLSSLPPPDPLSQKTSFTLANLQETSELSKLSHVRVKVDNFLDRLPSQLASKDPEGILDKSTSEQETTCLEIQVEENRRVLGTNHPYTLKSIASLAFVYFNRKRWEEAEKLHMEVIEIGSEVLGPEHPDILASITNLVSISSLQKRWVKAAKLEIHVIEIREKMLGAEHPDTLASIASLSSIYRAQGRWEKAEQLDIQVIKTQTKVLGAEHPETLTSLANLVPILSFQKRWVEAEKLEIHVIELRKKVLGAEHPDTLASIAKLASIYQNQGWQEEAKELEREMAEISRR